MSFVSAVLSTATLVSLTTGKTVDVYKYFRRDYSLDSSLYPEPYPTPSQGGKVHIVFTAESESSESFPNYTRPYTVDFGLNESFTIDSGVSLPPYINWMFCDYEYASGQVWISSHFPDEYVLESLTQIEVTDSQGNVMGRSKDITFQHAGLELLYVSIRDLNQFGQNVPEVVMHFYNYYTDSAFNIAELYFNGVLLNGKDVIYVNPLQHVVVTHNITEDQYVVHNGTFYTISVVLVDGLSFGFGGRYLNPQQKWPIVGVPIASQCPYPSTNAANNQLVTGELYVNSLYLDTNTTCTSSAYNILSDFNQNWASLDSNTLTLGTSISESDSESKLESDGNLADIVASMTVFDDLSPADGIVGASDLVAVTQDVWQQSLQRRLDLSEAMTSVSCATNRQIGTFTGVTDIQIITFNFAGCQPNALNATSFSLSSVYNYFENARLNQMPDATWASVQAFKKYFDSEPYGLTASEINIGIGSALAAGVQGLILDAVDVTFATSDSETWKSVGKLLSSVDYLQQEGYLSVAAPHGAPISTSDGNITVSSSLWSSLRAVDELIIVAVNLNCDGYDLASCDAGKNVHWTCQDHTVTQVNITLPDDLQQNVNVKEIVSGKTTDVNFETKIINGTILQWSSVSLDASDTTRVFLLSSD